MGLDRAGRYHDALKAVEVERNGNMENWIAELRSSVK